MRHYGYLLAEPEARGAVSKALGGALLLALVPLLWRLAPSRLMAAVLVWWTFESLQTVICSVAYAIKPWPVPAGVSICSARLDFDLGAIGIMLVAMLLAAIVKASNTKQQGSKS